MSVVIRLSRAGTNRKPFYRLVAAAKTKPRDGRFLEVVGTYDPKAEAGGFQLKTERYAYWLEKGALPTKRVSDLVKKASEKGASGN